jgi:hypothetical protein
MPQTIGMEASRATLPRSSESIAALASKLINPEKSLTVIIRSGRVGRSIEVLEDGGDRPRTMALFPEDHCEGLKGIGLLFGIRSRGVVRALVDSGLRCWLFEICAAQDLWTVGKRADSLDLPAFGGEPQRLAQ